MMRDGGDAAARRAQCVQIAEEAGRFVRSRFGNPGTVSGKGSLDEFDRIIDVVTEVDHLSEQLILHAIARIDEDAVVLAEEGGLLRVDGARVNAETAEEAGGEIWLVDPIDGTINFAHGVPHFCVSVACWHNSVPLAGAIHDPMVGETFSFEGSGSDSRAYIDEQPHVLHDEAHTANAICYVGGGGPSLVPLLRRFRSWRRMGSAALALAWVGAGRCGAYVQPGSLRPWDWAAGIPFVQAAGGVVTDSGGVDFVPRLHGMTGLIAASPAIHEQIADDAAAASASG